MATGRNSIGFEIENAFRDLIFANKDTAVATSNDRILHRIQDHLEFLKTQSDGKGKFKYLNKHYKFPVKTRQEINLFINPLKSIKQINKNTMEVVYADTPGKEFDGDWKQLMPTCPKKTKSGQLQLF